MFRKLVRLGKGGAKCIQIIWCQSQMLILQRKKIQGIDAQKLSCIDKSTKNGSQMKNFQSM